MKFFLPVFFIILILFSFITSGCNPSSSDSGTAILRGLVVDTTNASRVRGATVFLEQLNLSTATNDSGIFILTNLAAGTYKLTVSKSGYISYTTSVDIAADDTNKWVTIPLVTNSIYASNIIEMDINTAGCFYRVNGVTGFSVPDNSLEKDVQIRDTIVGSDTLIYLRSGDQDFNFLGYQTWFSNRYVLDLTKSQFDTLSAYWTEDGLKRPEDRDFPNHNGLEYYINVNDFHNSVWYFYLRGRWPGEPAKRTYGVMFINSAWNEAGLRKIRVYIKINMAGDYIFYPFNSK
jgi:hypothetical protein